MLESRIFGKRWWREWMFLRRSDVGRRCDIGKGRYGRQGWGQRYRAHKHKWRVIKMQFESFAQSEVICDCCPFREAHLLSRRTVRCPMLKREKRNELVRRFQISPDMDPDVNLATSLWLCHRLSNSFIYSAPQQMLSTIIAPCLSVPQHHPPPPPPPPLAVYIQRVRSTRLHTLKPSSTCWNSTSQKRLSVRRSYLFFF